MKLYEITTGAIGESYERSYAWAESKDEAIRLALDPGAELFPDKRPEDFRIRELFDADDWQDCGFITKPTDHGWPD